MSFYWRHGLFWIPIIQRFIIAKKVPKLSKPSKNGLQKVYFWRHLSLMILALLVHCVYMAAQSINCFVCLFWPPKPPLITHNPTLAVKCQFTTYIKSAMMKPMAVISLNSNDKRDITLSHWVWSVGISFHDRVWFVYIFSQGSYSAASMSSTFQMYDHIVFIDVCMNRS